MHAKNTRSLISWQRDGAGGQAHLPQTGKRSFEASICEQQDDKTQPNIAQEHLSHCRKSFSSFRFSIVAGTILKLDDVPLNYFPLYAEYTYVYVDIFFPFLFFFLIRTRAQQGRTRAPLRSTAIIRDDGFFRIRRFESDGNI